MSSFKLKEEDEETMMILGDLTYSKPYVVLELLKDEMLKNGPGGMMSRHKT